MLGSEPYLKEFFTDKKKMFTSEKLNLRREVDTNEKVLEAGKYAIIPACK